MLYILQVIEYRKSRGQYAPSSTARYLDTAMQLNENMEETCICDEVEVRPQLTVQIR